jgi:hypothetical protein
MRRCQGPAPRDPGLYTFASIHQIAEKVSSRKLIFSILHRLALRNLQKGFYVSPEQKPDHNM